jgi:hypothetical protein
MKHILKSQIKQFAATWSGAKTADLRNTDRPFTIGDMVVLREYDHLQDSYSGREIEAVITYITSQQNQCALSQLAIAPEYCILNLAIVARRDA